MIGTGASELISAAILALADFGDEVIVPEPWFDVYGAGISLAGAVQVDVPLQRTTAGYRLDAPAIEAAITDRTRIILLNNPHNPTGAVFDSEQLAELASIAQRHDLIVLSDEVYEHIVFPPARHVPMATVPGMRERTVTFGSGGKTFSLTGWKVGWATGARRPDSRRPGSPTTHVLCQQRPLPAGDCGWPAPGDEYFEVGRPDGRRPSAAGRRAGQVGPRRGADGRLLLPRHRCHRVGLAGRRRLRRSHRAQRRCGRHSRGAPEQRGAGVELVRWTFCKRPEVLQEALRRLAATDLRGPVVKR